MTPVAGVAWDAFVAADPSLAQAARRLLGRSGTDEGLLATVRGADLPRIHPVYVGFVAGRLVTVVLAGSVKLRDLREDGRYALHAHQDPAVPHELLLRGRAVELAGDIRGVVVAGWSFDVAASDGVFELRVARVTLGERADAEAWPPVYRSWRAPAS